MKTIKDLRNQPGLPDWMDYPQHHISFDGQQFLMTGLTSQDMMVKGPWGHSTFPEMGALKRIRERTESHVGCFIDVGANVGNHSVFFANFCGVRQLYSIEAHPSVFEVLKFNCDKNIPESCGFTLFGCAASKQKGVLGMRPISPRRVGITQVTKRDGADIEVESCTLDELIGDERVAFIKVDVEGHEPEVFQGAPRILERDQPLIMAEAPSKKRKRALSEILKPFGYERGRRRFGLNYFWNPT